MLATTLTDAERAVMEEAMRSGAYAIHMEGFLRRAELTSEAAHEAYQSALQKIKQGEGGA